MRLPTTPVMIDPVWMPAAHQHARFVKAHDMQAHVACFSHTMLQPMI
jgi:hypothetical protein